VRTDEAQGMTHGIRSEDDPVDEMIRARAILAPMSGVTDIPFRMMARKFGCAFAFTEMIDVNGIVYGSRKSFRLMDRSPGDSPLGIQIVGEDADKLLYVGKMCEEKGFRILDINAGCPARKVVKGGKGSALLKDIVKLAGIVRKLAGTLKIPVTVKIRSGWDENNLNYMEAAKAVASEGAAAICVHPRTKEQMYKGRADHEIIREIKEVVNIPVFASGNIFTASDAANVLRTTGCDAVFVARGALGKPWLFREINSLLSGGTPPEAPGFNAIKEAVIEHFSLCLSFYDIGITRKRMYKHLAWYLKRFKNLNEVMEEYRKVGDLGSFRGFMARLSLDEKNRLYFRRWFAIPR